MPAFFKSFLHDPDCAALAAMRAKCTPDLLCRQPAGPDAAAGERDCLLRDGRRLLPVRDRANLKAEEKIQLPKLKKNLDRYQIVPVFFYCT